MTGPVVQSHGPTGVILDERYLLGLEAQYEQVFGKEGWRMPSMNEQRKESLARDVLMLVREIRSLRTQLEAKKSKKEAHV